MLSTINARTTLNDILKLLLKEEVVAYSKLLSMGTQEDIIHKH
jgi:hypothetical protein